MAQANSTSFITQALATGNFSVLGEAIGAFGDIPTLLSTIGGTVTIFGPTDQAFADGGISNAAELDSSVLLNHGTFGSIDAATLLANDCTEYQNLSGGKLVIKVADETIFVNGVTVNKNFADIKGDDGVFHGVDGIIPQTDSSCTSTTEAPAPAPTQETQAPAPTDAVDAKAESASSRMK